MGHGVPKNRDYLCFSSTNAEVSDLLTPSGDAANYSLVTMRGNFWVSGKMFVFCILGHCASRSYPDLLVSIDYMLVRLFDFLGL